MTDTLSINHALSPLISHIAENRFANASRHASALRMNVESWTESLCRLRKDVDNDRDALSADRPTASPDVEPGEWQDWEHRVKDAQARYESVCELQSAMLRLSHALRSVAEAANNRACDRENTANA